MSIAYIGLGSNMLQPRQQLLSAKETLENVKNISVLAFSDLYQSEAMIVEGSEPQDDYINAVIKLQTSLNPNQLLSCLQNIENLHGRERKSRWAARTLDLDILLFDDIQMTSEKLNLPHIGIAERNFVLYPLQQIDENINIPGFGKLKELVSNISNTGIKVLGRFI